MKQLKYKITTNGSFLKVFINNLLHICVVQKDIIGIQSWLEGSNWYVIEIYTTNKTIKCEYDDYEKWSKILNLLNQNL